MTRKPWDPPEVEPVVVDLEAERARAHERHSEKMLRFRGQVLLARQANAPISALRARAIEEWPDRDDGYREAAVQAALDLQREQGLRPRETVDVPRGDGKRIRKWLEEFLGERPNASAGAAYKAAVKQLGIEVKESSFTNYYFGPARRAKAKGSGAPATPPSNNGTEGAPARKAAPEATESKPEPEPARSVPRPAPDVGLDISLDIETEVGSVRVVKRQNGKGWSIWLNDVGDELCREITELAMKHLIGVPS